jgi:hypothetical protein
MGWDDL